MRTKSDNPVEVGMHVFERAGLGKAPFRCVGYERKVYMSCPGAPAQPGGTCDFCGMGIMHACLIQSSDRKTFVVGCDCVARTGDEGLIKAYKTSPEFRKVQREMRAAKAAKQLEELMALIEANESRLRELPSPNEYNPNLLSYAVWHRDHCGDTGRRQTLKFLKAILAGARMFNAGKGYYE